MRHPPPSIALCSRYAHHHACRRRQWLWWLPWRYDATSTGDLSEELSPVGARKGIDARISAEERAGFALRIQQMIAVRMSVAIRLRHAGHKDPVDTYTIAMRLRGMGYEHMSPVPMPQLADWPCSTTVRMGTLKVGNSPTSRLVMESNSLGSRSRLKNMRNCSWTRSTLLRRRSRCFMQA